MVQQRSRLQPVEQAFAIRRLQDGPQPVVAVAPLGVAAGERQQVQVVIAEHDGGRIAEAGNPAQHVERGGPAVDEVADEPEPVAGRVEAEEREQVVEFGGAALYVADGVDGHPLLSSTARASRA